MLVNDYRIVEVFKTNVQETTQANALTALLLQYFPGSRISFDLEDCDKVLRVEGDDFIADHIIDLITGNGFVCVILN